MEAEGYDMSREFYINDTGNQIEKFGMSLEARYLQLYKDDIVFPEDGYHGEDITDRAKEFAAIHGDKLVDADSDDRRKALIDYALPKNIASLREDLSLYHIEYDRWFPDSSLYEDGTVDKVMNLMKERGLTYEKDGAVWYKATEYGGEKDEVLIRQNGVATYFAVDIAYHYNKFAIRGFDTVIDVWGADHHGHVARIKGAMDAIGLSGDKLDIVLMQLVRLMKDGEPYRMSKRTGRSITLRDLIDLVPIDAARFHFNMREPGSTMDFDLDLAVEQSSQNPVYYVQYAHARICSILKKLTEDGVTIRGVTAKELAGLTDPAEISLIRRLAEYPGEIVTASVRRDPARLTHSVIDIATLYHKFYTTCHVRIDDEALMQARIALCLATRTVLAGALSLLKIGAPETM
jgi:arginyl-tRNA synthetase